MKADLSGTWQHKQGNNIIDEFNLTKDNDTEHYKMTYSLEDGELVEDYFGMGTIKVAPESRSGAVLDSNKFKGCLFNLTDNPDKLIITCGRNAIQYTINE